MKIYFFGSPSCDNCLELLNDLAGYNFDFTDEDEFCLVDAFDDNNEELCDEHEVDQLPHVKILDGDQVLFERVGMFDPDEMKQVVTRHNSI